MSVIDEIKSRLDIVDVISNYLPLRKSGRSYSGFCPFHPNTRTPAFVVFPESQTWRCFGACAEGGDVFSFVMKKEGIDFREALVRLAAQAGVTLEEASPEQRARRAVADRLADLVAVAADYYHHLFLYAPQGQGARDYVFRRGLSQETIETFKVGLALDSWNAGQDHFNTQGYSDQELIDAGLLTVSEEKGTRYDRFRNRLMIPIRDAGGRYVGFGARTLDPDGIPKYLNSPQSAVFDKGRLLFGLDLARRHIREARQVVIVEGYMDVMQAWQAGFHNVVAQMGTALTDDQLRLLKRYTKRFVLALDADAAGASATLRSLELARGVLDRDGEVRFDARGLVRHEGRLEADIHVVTLPEGRDPDDIIREDSEQWAGLIEQSKPVAEYVIEVVTQGLDLNDAKAKTVAVQQVLPLIDDIGDPLEREHYRQLLARKLRVDERVLRQVSARESGRRRPSGPQPMGQTIQAAGQGAQAVGLAAAMSGRRAGSERRLANYLRQCLAYPQLVPQVNERLQGCGQPAVREGDFTRVEDRAVWRLLRRRPDYSAVADASDLCDSQEDAFLCERIQQLLALPQTPESELERLPVQLVLSILDWRLDQTKALFDDLKELLDESGQQNPTVLELYAEQLRELPSQMRLLNRAREAVSAMGRRLA
jgi:DNA primase